MIHQLLHEAGQMAIAAGIVAALAVPVAALAMLVLRRHGERVLPRWQVPATGRLASSLPPEASDFLYLLLACILFVGYPLVIASTASLLESLGVFPTVPPPAAPPEPGSPARPDSATQLRSLGGTFVAAPLLLVVWLGLQVLLGGSIAWPTPRRVARWLAFGTGAWLVATPLVFAVHFLTNLVAVRLGITPDKHPLTQLGGAGHTVEWIVFGSAVCFFTPLAEEVLFRGLFVGWAAGRWYRPWTLMLLAGGLALLSGVGPEGTLAPLGFVALLGVGLYGLQRLGRGWPRFPERTVSTVYATAALFAAAHSAVWPTPIPLFVLGLALGYVAARSNGIAACVVVHGLFNAVSFTFLLRGGGG